MCSMNVSSRTAHAVRRDLPSCLADQLHHIRGRPQTDFLCMQSEQSERIFTKAS
eukprot:CAMPEP_0197882784 /NCGR_PEP_ID=MMETSP1439-20131203/9827_1 /TAXON_ID=66791 /ORGANISM="Gonyaulax spinifera, Strain CCMP409" /LENGTH=53 /DNA_ID=CAMNT_0043502465 /DNA_START=1 /DNA_END=158 /DNA_ORIENTATION=+